MTRKCHNHPLQITSWHRLEKTENTNSHKKRVIKALHSSVRWLQNQKGPQSTAHHNKGQRQSSHTQWKQQWINSNRTIALERTSAKTAGRLKCILLAQNLHIRFCCCKNLINGLARLYIVKVKRAKIKNHMGKRQIYKETSHTREPRGRVIPSEWSQGWKEQFKTVVKHR